MNDPSAALQGAIETVLVADPLVFSLVAGRVFDRVPRGALTPYVSFGPAQALEDDADCVEGFEITQQLDVWSTEPGYVQAKEVAGAVRKALHNAEITLAGFTLNEMTVRNIRYLRDPDGLTGHAVIEVRALLETGQS